MNKAKANAKRIESCKAIGGEKKRKGHKREKDFLKQYNPSTLNSPTEYGPTSDTSIAENHSILEKFKSILNYLGTTFNISNKSGKSIQFVLGNIPELDIDQNLAYIQDKENSKNLFDKYLKKSTSIRPADFLVYKDKENKNWIFFKMDDVINFIVQNAMWRKLDTGRIKGDFKNNSKKGTGAYITYEQRKTSHFLGISGGQGKKFIELLTANIPYVKDSFNY